MGNKNNRLTVFENIIDFIDFSDEDVPIKHAIQEHNTPYIFIALTLYGVTNETSYGPINLTYRELLKKYNKLFDQQDLTIIQSSAHVIDMHCISLFKDEYIDKINELKLYDEYRDIAYEAIIHGDVITLIVLVKCFGFNINSHSNLEEHYTIGDLLDLYKDDNYWNIIYTFMNKHYNYDRLRKFLRVTIEKKKELFEMYKLLYMFGCNGGIISNIMGKMYNDCINDVNVIIYLNKALKLNENNKLHVVFDLIYLLEKCKLLWLWLKENDYIDDIICCIFDMVFPKKIDMEYTRIPLLLI